MSSHAEQKSIFVIVPAYNEQETIGQVTEELAGCGYTVVLVDDGSQPVLSLPLQTKPLYHTRHSIIVINRIVMGEGPGLCILCSINNGVDRFDFFVYIV